MVMHQTEQSVVVSNLQQMCEFALSKRDVFPRLVGEGDGNLRRKER